MVMQGRREHSDSWKEETDLTQNILFSTEWQGWKKSEGNVILKPWPWSAPENCYIHVWKYKGGDKREWNSRDWFDKEYYVF